MFFSSILILMPVLIANAKIDPDLDVCETGISNAVYSDDGQTYVFKNNYYWKTNPLNTSTGIIGFADLVFNKWSEVKGDINLVFVIYKEELKSLITVFVVKDKWTAYKKGELLSSGLTTEWPKYKDLKVTLAFNEYKSQKVYILHNDNTQYILYDFQLLSKPTYMDSGSTAVRASSFIFMDIYSTQLRAINPIANYEGDGDLKELIDPKAIITYDKDFVVIGSKKYCIIRLTSNAQDAAQCVPQESTSKLLNCPLNINDRPKTTTTAPKVNTHSTLTPKPNPTHKSDESDGQIRAITTTDSSSVSTIAIVIITIVVGISCLVLVAAIIIARMITKPEGDVRYVSSKGEVSHEASHVSKRISEGSMVRTSASGLSTKSST